jgi:hypothetical protein
MRQLKDASSNSSEVRRMAHKAQRDYFKERAAHRERSGTALCSSSAVRPRFSLSLRGCRRDFGETKID